MRFGLSYYSEAFQNYATVEKGPAADGEISKLKDTPVETLSGCFQQRAMSQLLIIIFELTILPLCDLYEVTTAMRSKYRVMAEVGRL